MLLAPICCGRYGFASRACSKKVDQFRGTTGRAPMLICMLGEVELSQ